MIRNKMLLALPFILILNGCIIVSSDSVKEEFMSANWRSEQANNLANINKLILGLGRTDALKQMGTPAFSEAFKGRNGTEYQILYYRTQRQHDDGETTKDETTALVFENDKLVGWGNDALQRLP